MPAIPGPVNYPGTTEVNPIMRLVFGDLLRMVSVNPFRAAELLASMGIPPPTIRPFDPRNPTDAISALREAMEPFFGQLTQAMFGTQAQAAPTAPPQVAAAPAPAEGAVGGGLGPYVGPPPAAVAAPRGVSIQSAPQGGAAQPAAVATPKQPPKGTPAPADATTVDWASLFSGIQMPEAPRVQAPQAPSPPGAGALPSNNAAQLIAALMGGGQSQAGPRAAPQTLSEILAGLV